MSHARKRLFLMVLVLCLIVTLPATAQTSSFSIDVLAGAGGKITPGDTTARTGTNKTFTLKPNKGYHLAEARLNGNTIFEDRKDPSVPNSGDAPPLPSDSNLRRSRTTKVYKYQFKNIQKDHSLEAVFEADTFFLEVGRAGEGSGVVVSSSGGISCGDACVGIVPYNTTVTLTATGEEGSVFDGWTGSCRSKSGVCTIKMTKASSATAAFAPVFPLTVLIAGEGNVKSTPKGIDCGQSCSAMVKADTRVKLKAMADPGSLFYGWTGCPSVSGARCTVAMNQAQHVEADFVSKNVPAYHPDTVDLPESYIIPAPAVVPNGKGAVGHCYIESLAVLMAYLDPTVTMEEVFTFAGLGAALTYDSYGKAFSSFPPDNWTWTVQKRVLQNYGVHFVIGHSTGMSKEYRKSAAAEIVHGSGDDAFNTLKAVIASGRPVQVHIDLAYLPGFTHLPPGLSHFIIITGYDADGVYWTDAEPQYRDIPIEPSEYIDVKIPIADFMKSWDEAGAINKGQFTYCAPYWMLFLEETAASQVQRIPASDILALQKALSQNNAAVIEGNLESNFSKTEWGKIALAKRLFAEYLRARYFDGAGNIYELLATEYQGCSALSLDEKKGKLMGVIKLLETEARPLY